MQIDFCLDNVALELLTMTLIIINDSFSNKEFSLKPIAILYRVFDEILNIYFKLCL